MTSGRLVARALFSDAELELTEGQGEKSLTLMAHSALGDNDASFSCPLRYLVDSVQTQLLISLTK